jgi:hypothetical protein
MIKMTKVKAFKLNPKLCRQHNEECLIFSLYDDSGNPCSSRFMWEETESGWRCKKCGLFIPK